MARKAWKDLAPSTRARYVRAARKNGIDAKSAPALYSGGFLPSHEIYGKKPPRRQMAQGATPTPRQVAGLERLARKGKLQNVDDVIERALDAGASYDQVEKILKQRAQLRRMPNEQRKRLGREWFDRRQTELPVELYWY